MKPCWIFSVCLCLLTQSAWASDFDDVIQPLLKNRCVRCHGPTKPKAGLDLSNPGSVLRGGENGVAVTARNLEKSLLWQRIEAGEMPPDQPLADAEKELIRQWIVAGAKGLKEGPQGVVDHWAFRRLHNPALPTVKDASRVRTSIDQHLQATLESQGLTLGTDADRATLARRVAFTLTGLPPTPDEIDTFLDDRAPDAYERFVEPFLASPRYGEHWGKHWLDAVGYADTNGYFGKESDRPHSWRYRDYVVDSFNIDKPFDRFLREQLAGDELAGVVLPGAGITPAQKELLIATHLLRNGPDGTDDSAPSPDAKRIDRYAALEATQQVVYTSLLALSIKCARCHDHKFEPITQREYYQAQSIFYPAFNPNQWMIPRQRVISAATGAEKAAWESAQRSLESQLAALRSEFRGYVSRIRKRGRELFRDEFEKPIDWIAAPAGTPDGHGDMGHLVVASGTDSWLATPQNIEWTPAEIGAKVQVTFDLLADRAHPEDAACQYFGYAIAANNFQGSPAGEGGNLYIEGRFDGTAKLYRLRPGEKRYESIGEIGAAKYAPGRNFGVRITNIGEGKYRLEHLVDYMPEGKQFVVSREDLPSGPFAFYRYPARNYVVGDLNIEEFPAQPNYTGTALFTDADGGPVAERWNAAAPKDAPPPAAVLLDKPEVGKHSADRQGPRLRIIVGSQEESWLCTKKSFDWTPNNVGQSIQATFDLIDDHLELPGGGMSAAAPHIGYYISAHNFNKRRATEPGNLLIDGGVPRPTHVYRDYPSMKAPPPQPVGSARTTPGRNYGVRITNAGEGKYQLHHLVDRVPDGSPLTLTATDLPDGAFGFYFADGRSFVVENVTIAEGEFAKYDSPADVQQLADFGTRLTEFTARVQALENQRTLTPGVDVAWVSDLSPQPPQVFLLKRGIYGEHGDEVQPGGLAVLSDADNPFEVAPPAGGTTTGRRLALANWLLKADSRPYSLMVRVRANWLWQHYFGVGLVPTSENFGVSGTKPSHPELLEHLAAEFVRADGSLKEFHRQVLLSSAFRQTSAPHAKGLAADADNRLVWRFPLRRLDAEAVRDAMLMTTGELSPSLGGPPVMLDGVDGHGSNGEVTPQESGPAALRRTLYVQRRRNVLPTFLQLFDFPAIAATCAERSHSTVALQSLAQLNSPFARRRAAAFAERLAREVPDDNARVLRAFVLCAGRQPTAEELSDAVEFLRDQQKTYGVASDGPTKALTDFCQMMFASNLFLYVE